MKSCLQGLAKNLGALTVSCQAGASLPFSENIASSHLQLADWRTTKARSDVAKSLNKVKVDKIGIMKSRVWLKVNTLGQC